MSVVRLMVSLAVMLTTVCGAWMTGALAVAADPPAKAAAVSAKDNKADAKVLDGRLPLGADGKPLNLDFELGSLKDWTAEGDAFKDQPIKGEINQNRTFGEGKRSRLQGEFWIGGYEKNQDKPTGTLTSVSFHVTHPFCAFRIGGGSHADTRVELIDKSNGKVFFKISGQDQEDMLPVVVDLRNQLGHEIFIRIVDQNTEGWGHVNFDDFRFYKAQPKFTYAVQGAPAPAGRADTPGRDHRPCR